MTKCSVRSCREKGTTTWLLIAGEPSLCGHHYDHPTPQFADLVAAANAPPDDFDIPLDLPLPRLPRYLTVDKDTWVTRDNKVIPIRQLEDSHLANINRMLNRIKGSLDEVDEDGAPTGADMPSDVEEMFDCKRRAIKAEIERRED